MGLFGKRSCYTPQAPEGPFTGSVAQRAADKLSLQELEHLHRYMAYPAYWPGLKTYAALREERAARRHRHWFNDIGSRLALAAEAGFTPVLDADDKPLRRCVGSGRAGEALFAQAMEIPEEERGAAFERLARLMMR